MAVQSLWNLGGLTWVELGKRTYKEILEDDVLGSAAQLAYYFLFALFPLLIFLTSIFGFIVGANNDLRGELFSYLGTVLPRSAVEMVQSVIQEVSQASSGGKITIGLFLALWAASSGLAAITETLNRAYSLKETRPFWKVRLVALGLTVSLALLVTSALVIILFGGHIAEYFETTLGLGTVVGVIWRVLQYLIALAFVLIAFALIYYFSPDVKEQRWFWVTPGSVVGVGLWLLVSFGFRIYLGYFDSYSATYGSLGAVIILLLWLYFTGIAILIGGEINSEIENAAAQAGHPEAKEEGEKAPNQKEQTDTETKEKKQPIEAEIIEPDGKQVWAQKDKPTAQPVGQAPQPNFISRIATIGSMVVGVFMSFGGSSKNERNR